MSRMALDSGAEIPQILHALDQGTVMIKFFRKKQKPEKRIFCLKTDTFEILQFPMARGRLTQFEETSECRERCSSVCCKAIQWLRVIITSTSPLLLVVHAHTHIHTMCGEVCVCVCVCLFSERETQCINILKGLGFEVQGS